MLCLKTPGSHRRGELHQLAAIRSAMAVKRVARPAVIIQSGFAARFATAVVAVSFGMSRALRAIATSAGAT
jgi:hypothetical protein